MHKVEYRTNMALKKISLERLGEDVRDISLRRDMTYLNDLVAHGLDGAHVPELNMSSFSTRLRVAGDIDSARVVTMHDRR